MSPKYFNAHHSPVGAFATLTLGMKGSRGGFGLELAGPANEGIYVGIQDRDGKGYQALPFFDPPQSQAEDYDVEGLSDFQHEGTVRFFADNEVDRNFGAAIDEWMAGDMSFRIYSPPTRVPDPDQFDAKDALAPSVLVELTLDNREGSVSRKAFFGYGGSDRTVGMRLLNTPGLVGVGQGTSIAIATDDLTMIAGLGWQPEAVLTPRLAQNLGFMLGSLGLIVGEVPAGEQRTFKFAVGFFKHGQATTGIRSKYLYRRWFEQVEEVLSHALGRFDVVKEASQVFDSRLAEHLNPERAFMAAHAIRSYFGATQLLDDELGKPLWVVHEGEYRMMNTFDLTVDQAFFELVCNPWTVRNELDQFVDRYSYVDDVQFPGNGELFPGGLAFTHDMGVANAFSRAGHSGYEQAGLKGCFSYMSSEELCNWVLTAGLYLAHTKDRNWARSRRSTFLDCLTSLENRDHPEDEKRNGVMGLDGARCAGGAEITTYDSLDTSLGQARNNVYLAVKNWAAYEFLAWILHYLEEPTAKKRAQSQASRAVSSVLESRDSQGYFPAVIGEGNEARIIPAIEGLVYPFVAGIEVDDEALKVGLKQHLDLVLRKGVCKFDDGGWRLSSTSGNSWLSKIYLCQYIAEQILGSPPDVEADRAHVSWLMADENIYYAWSDQMLHGKAVGSRYYPRGVTSLMWLATSDQPISEIEALLFG